MTAAKAIVGGFLAAGLASFAASLGITEAHVLEALQEALVTAAVGGLVTYVVPNRGFTREGKPVQPGELGYGAVELVVGVLLVLILVVVLLRLL